jgi:hypothetical protein
MTAAKHPTPFARWFDELLEPVKAALRHPQHGPVTPRPAASKALHPAPPVPVSPQYVRSGDLARSSQLNAQGNSPLELPASLPASMLLLSADDGIRTTLAMLHDLQARNYQGDVVLLHVCRSPAELAQAGELQTAADNYPELSLLVHFDDLAGPFCAEALRLAVPDVTQRATWMSGPDGFLEMVQACWRSQALSVPLHGGFCASAPARNTPAPETVTA